MQKRHCLKNIFLLVICVVLLLTFAVLVQQFSKSPKVFAEGVTVGEYLSNLEPLSSTVGYSNLKYDENLDGGQISFIVGGKRTYFPKGLIAHAQAELVYDLGDHNYQHFSTYLGVDASQNGKGEVTFSAYTSTDNVTWEEILSATTKKSTDEAIYLNCSVVGKRYLKFVFDAGSTNSNDHSGLGDAKLYTDGYDFDKAETLFSTVEEYNSTLTGKTTTQILEGNLSALMQRYFVERVGYDNLRNSFLKGQNESERRAMLNWLLNDEKALKDFVTGGDPNGGDFIKSLILLTELYTKHSADLSDTTPLFSPETGSTRNRGDLYRTMMIALALTNDRPVYGWVNNSTVIDPMARYEAYKKTYLAEDYHLRYEIFENLCVEEMRYLMTSRINPEEIYWLNAYATIKYGSATYPAVYSPHRHIAYGRDWNYAAKGYLKEENYQKYSEKYMLEQFGVGYSSDPRIWMALEGSQICWGIAYLATNFASAFGVPCHYVRQNGHAACFVYDKDEQGRTVWSIDNDISGWSDTWMNEDTVGNGNYRMLCGWGTTFDEQVTLQNGTYILLSSTALDDQENYEKAELMLTLASFVGEDQKESLYREVLTVMPYHLDAWLGLVRLYINTAKTDSELVSLSEEIAQNMYCFPLPMHDLLGLIKKELTTRSAVEDQTKANSALVMLANVENIDNTTLVKATNVKNDESAKALIAQLSPVVTEANYILGKVEDVKLATFSFDGENKNKLLFNEKYENVRYKYSIDGGATWSLGLVTSKAQMYYAFTDTEIATISATNDILVWLEGWGDTINIDNAFRIDILEGTEVSDLENNDNEDKFFGTLGVVEYSLDNTTWQDLTAETMFSGAQTVYVRNKRSGVTLDGTVSTFTFTNGDTSTRSYIHISDLELYAFSSQETSRSQDQAAHAIDGKLSTRWHTLWDGSDGEKYYIVKLSSSKFISGLDYTPVKGGGNGTILGLDVFVSTNGTDWTLATSESGLTNDDTKKSLSFDPVFGQYIKIVGSNTVGSYCSARLFEFFEDTTLSAKTVSSLQISTAPTQKVYVLGQKINYKGLKARLLYEDGSFSICPVELLTLDDISADTLGTVSVPIKYQGLTASFDVEVIRIEDSVARIGEDYYHSLLDAINADGNGTIDLLKDIEITSSYTITKSVTIDGGNHTITRGTDFTSAMFIVSGTGSLTLQNLTLDGGAVWTGDTHQVLNRGTTNSGIVSQSALIKGMDNATISLNNCHLQNNYNDYSANAQNTGGALFLNSKSKLTVTDSHITNCYSRLFGSAIYARDNSSFTINSGLFSGCSGTSQWNTSLFCVDNTSSSTINGGEYKNNLGYNKGGVFWISGGSLTVNGGKFENNSATLGSGIFIGGGAKISIKDFETFGDIYIPSGKKIYILGALSGKLVNIQLESTADDTTIAVCEDETIKYKALKSLQVADRLLYILGTDIKIKGTSEAVASIKSGDRDILYLEFTDALKSAESGDTITLKKDVTLASTATVSAPLTIDFGSCSLVGDSYLTTDLCMEKLTSKITIKNHVYNQNITYVWSSDNTTCTATGTCICGKTHTETVATEKTTKAGVHDGEKTEKGKVQFEYAEFSTQEKVLSEIKKDHVYDQNITYVWSSDNTTCTATGTCTCGKTHTETVTAKSSETDADGIVAEFSYGEFSSQQKLNKSSAPDTQSGTGSGTQQDTSSGTSSGTQQDTSSGTQSGTNDEEKVSPKEPKSPDKDHKKIIIIVAVAVVSGLIIGTIVAVAVKKKKSKTKNK